MAETPYEDVAVETHPLLSNNTSTNKDTINLRTFSLDDPRPKDPLTRLNNDVTTTKNHHNPKLHLLDIPPARIPKYGAAQSSSRVINDFSRYTTSIFTSEVHNESSYRREVNAGKMQLGNLFRRFTAIPFSLVYGVALYFMLRRIFFDVETEREYSSATRSDRNKSAGLDSNQLKVNAKVDIEWGELRFEFIGVSVGFSVILASLSIFSRTFRCLMLLTLPCLITGRTRIALFTFITGLLFNRPIAGIAYSLNAIFEKSSRPKPIPSIVSENLFIVGLLLISISMIILVVDAISYMRSYYSDNSYDNKNIKGRTKALWKSKQLPEILPLRRWEVSKGYQTSISCAKKFNSLGFLGSTFTSLLFTLVSGVIVLADYHLQRIVQSILNQDSNTSNPSNKGTVEISVTKYVVIGVFLAIAFASRVVENLLSVGLRSRMCDAVYMERVLERADYLHFQISTGRVQRRTQLTLTILANLEKKRRSRKMIAPLQKMKTCLWRVCYCGCCKRTIVCPGCEWNVMKADSVSIKFTVGSINVKESICLDCHQDFRDLSVVDQREEYFSESMEVQNVKEHYFNKDIVEFWDDIYNSSI